MGGVTFADVLKALPLGLQSGIVDSVTRLFTEGDLTPLALEGDVANGDFKPLIPASPLSQSRLVALYTAVLSGEHHLQRTRAI